jgi:hypothetical protein
MSVFSGQPKSTAETTGVVPANQPSLMNEGDIKRILYLDQIYDPDIHPVADMAKYIAPLEGMIVIDVPDHRLLQVKHVDRYNTWKTTFENYFLLPEKDISDYNLFPQHEYGFLQGELALAIDFSTRPAVARVDANAVAPNATYAMLYKGAIISEKGEIISATYSGLDLENNRIGVSPVVYDNVENLTVMGCNTFSVTQNEAALPNGTRCTLVFYDQSGRPIPPTYPVVVQHCAYLRDHQLDVRYVESIELVSPWFTNSTKPNTLFVPVNLPLSSVEFRALIRYSNGDVVEQPVNSFNGDNGFRLDGLNQYKPTTPGQISDEIVLTYFFSEGEQASIAQAGAPRHMSNVYEIVATPAQGAYSPRIYTYPYWDPAVGYRLKHYLTDLDRKYCRDVTDQVTLNESSPVFQGQLFGQEQPMIFNLNMRDVSAMYEPWSFIQYSTITLFNPATAVGRKWNVRHDYNSPGFPNMTVEFWSQTGGGNPGRFANVTTVDEFLNAGYWAFNPMYDPRTEVKAPQPTHFDLVREDGTYTSAIPIAAFNQLPISSIALSNGGTLYIRWVLREADGNELQLGVSAAVCTKITAPTT